MLRRTVTPLTLVLILASTAAGCGSASPRKAPDRQAAWDESQVMHLAGIETVDDGLSYRLVSHPECTAAVVLVSRSMVDTYGGAGDTIATNPDGTAGVKVTAAERATCLRRFTAALTRVR